MNFHQISDLKRTDPVKTKEAFSKAHEIVVHAERWRSIKHKPDLTQKYLKVAISKGSLLPAREK